MAELRIALGRCDPRGGCRAAQRGLRDRVAGQCCADWTGCYPHTGLPSESQPRAESSVWAALVVAAKLDRHDDAATRRHGASEASP